MPILTSLTNLCILYYSSQSAPHLFIGPQNYTVQSHRNHNLHYSGTFIVTLILSVLLALSNDHNPSPLFRLLLSAFLGLKKLILSLSASFTFSAI